MSTRSSLWFVTVLMLSLPPAAAQSGRSVSCDRACLAGIMTSYLAAMAAHDPSKVATDHVRFTEDTKEMPLGEGLWKNVTALRPYRVDFIDVKEGVAATHTVVEESGKPVLLAVRLGVVNRRITEVETMAVRSREEGVLFVPDAFKTPNPGMAYVPTAAERNTRDDLVRIASMYPAGLRAGSFLMPDVPMSDDAYRFENGQKMAGPGCSFRPPGCENMKGQAVPRLANLTYRVVAVDEEMGTVLLWQNFGAGSVPGAGAAAGNAIVTFEAFKVYGGKIHAAEAILELLPVGALSGWDGPRSK
jgi:hypothetical protein